MDGCLQGKVFGRVVVESFIPLPGTDGMALDLLPGDCSPNEVPWFPIGWILNTIHA